MGTTTSPPPATLPPTGVTVVTKNAFFTYIEGASGASHRHAVQVWTVAEQGWTFNIYTGGIYDFAGKKETNTFHKKHLVTLSGTATLAAKAQSIYEKRTINFQATTMSRNQRAAPYVTGIKSNLPTGSPSEKTNQARTMQADLYMPKGYGNKLSGTALTVIDCSAFADWTTLAQLFAVALARGATGLAPHSDQFVTDGVWHPTIDFGIACVHESDGGILKTPAKSKALVQVHLLEVNGGGRFVKCHVHHLANAVD